MRRWRSSPSRIGANAGSPPTADVRLVSRQRSGTNPRSDPHPRGQSGPVHGGSVVVVVVDPGVLVVEVVLARVVVVIACEVEVVELVVTMVEDVVLVLGRVVVDEVVVGPVTVVVEELVLVVVSSGSVDEVVLVEGAVVVLVVGGSVVDVLVSGGSVVGGAWLVDVVVDDEVVVDASDGVVDEVVDGAEVEVVVLGSGAVEEVVDDGGGAVDVVVVGPGAVLVVVLGAGRVEVEVDDDVEVEDAGRILGAQAENSEVLPFESVAVAVTNSVGPIVREREAVKAACPSASVATTRDPTCSGPSPCPLASHAGVAKSSIVKFVSGVLSRTPSTVAPPAKLGSRTG